MSNIAGLPRERRRMAGWTWSFVFTLLLAGGIWGFWRYALKPTGPIATARRGAPAPVVVAQVERKAVPDSIRAIGRAESIATVNIRPQISGQLTQVHFVQGQFAKAGDLLFTIDPRPFEAALQSAQATLAKDKAMAADAAVAAQWTSDLFEAKVAQVRERDQTRATANSLAAAVQADEAAVRMAQLNLDYCTLRSPIAGRTGALAVTAGNVVKAEDTALVTIDQIAPIYVSFSIPEQHLGRVRAAQAAGTPQVEAVIPGDSGPAERGELIFVDSQVDPATGTIRLRALMPNEDHRLWPAQYVQVTLILAMQPDLVVVPASAIQESQAGSFVYVIGPDDTANVVPVTTGRPVDNAVIVESGLSGNETVVIDGQLRLVDGAKVAVKAAESNRLGPSATTSSPARQAPAPSSQAVELGR